MVFWLAWFFSPVGALILPLLCSLFWYLLPRWRKALTPRVRAWIHLGLLSSSSLAFFWFLTAPLEVFVRGGTHVLEWFLRTELTHALYQDAFEFRLLVAPLLIQMILTVYAILFTLLEQIATWLAVRQFQQTKTDGLIILETNTSLAFSYGWWRPRIYVSRYVWDSPLRQAIVAHEAEHCRRFDPLRLGAVRFLYRLALLNPFATWLLRAYQLELELICDRKASAQIGVKRYTTALMDYVEMRQIRLPAISNFSNTTMLKSRIQFLLGQTAHSRVLLFGSLFFVVGLVISALWQRQGNIIFQNPAEFVRYFKPVMHLGMQSQLRTGSDHLFVLTIYPNSLADQAGFQAGDEILSICGQSPIEIVMTPWKKCEFLVKRLSAPQELRFFFDRSQTMPK